MMRSTDHYCSRQRFVANSSEDEINYTPIIEKDWMTWNTLARLVIINRVQCQGTGDGKANGQPPSSATITNNERVLTSLVSGAIAGGVAKTVIAPLDRTKIYFQTSPDARFSSRNAINYVSNIRQHTGFWSLWRGNSATMARILPYAAVKFTAHEEFKKLLRVESTPKNEVTRFFCGSMAGVVAQSVTYPLDLTRARLAVHSEYKSLSDVFSKTIRSDGLRGLYKGYIPTMLGVIPYAGCSFYCYEGLKRLWTKEFGPGSVGGFERLCFGAFSGIIGQSSSYPLDIVRRRLQTGVTINSPAGGIQVLTMLVHIARTEGVVGGLYKGLSMNWVKGPVAAGISFAMFDWTNGVLREWVLDNRGRK